MALLCGGAQKSPVEVELSPHTLKTERFDRNNRPKEAGGKNVEMTGQTVWVAGVNYALGYTYTTVADHDGGKVVRLKPDRIKISCTQATTIWLPRDCGNDLVEHENGHYALADFAYKRLNARAAAFGKTILSQTFNGKSEDDAKSKFDEYFDKQFRQPYFRYLDDLSEEYDKLTEHGNNHKITADEAAKAVMAKQR